MTIELDMFSPFMEDGILSNIDGGLVITLEGYRCDAVNSEFSKKPA